MLFVLFRQRDEPKIAESAATSDEENEDGDFTVYECPGLAPVSSSSVCVCAYVCIYIFQGGLT